MLVSSKAFRLKPLAIDIRSQADNPTRHSWQHFNFRSDRWQNINQEEGRAYQLNAYRVLLTRARQGMVICIPEGNPADATRLPEFYDPTYEYFKGLGIEEI